MGCNSKTLGSFGYGDIAPLAFDVELAEEDCGPDLVLVGVFVRAAKTSTGVVGKGARQ